MLHQAVEQVLRYLILALLEQDVRTHNLSELKQHLKKCAFELSGFLSAKEEQHLFILLDTSYSAARYMDSFNCEATNVGKLLSHVEDFLKKAGDTFNKTIAAFEG